MSQNASSKVLFLVYCSVFLSAVFGGAGFVFMKHALAAFPIPWFIFWRFFISVVVLLPFMAAKILAAPRQTIRDGVIIGTMFFVATMIQSKGIAGTDAGRSAFINSTSVVIVPLLQALLTRTMPSSKVFAGCLLCLSGVGILTLPQAAAHADQGAEAWVFAGTCIFAYQMIFFRRAAQRGDPGIVSFVQFATLAIWALPTALFFSPSPVIEGYKGIGGILYTGIMMNIAMIMVSNNALRYISPTSLTVIASMQAMYGALFGSLMLGEKITVQLILSGCVILIGILTVILPPPARHRPIDLLGKR